MEPLRIFVAKRFHTMDESLPLATAVGVIGSRIVAVGDMATMEPWKKGREVIVDLTLRTRWSCRASSTTISTRSLAHC